MKAIILAAGRGSRLNHLTEERPKCLVELGGVPLLEWQIAALRAGGIDDIIVVVGYKAAAIARPGIRCVENRDWATTNMLWSLLSARHEIDGPVLVSYSDIVYSPATVSALASAPSDLAISYDRNWLSLWQARFADPLDDAESFRLRASGMIDEIGEKPTSLSEIEGQYMGLIRLAPTSLGWIDSLLARDPEKGRRLAMTHLLNRLIVEGRDVKAVPAIGGWCEVDNPTDLAVAERLLKEKHLGWPGGPAW